MKVYTVHEPPPRKDRGGAADPERMVFVRDGFYFWAFLLGPLWMIWNGLWLVLLIYAVAVAGLHMALAALGASAAVKATVGVLIALLVGLEAATLRRWSLRRWIDRGVVVAPDLEAAERRFFDAWMAQDAVPQSPAASSAPSSPPPAPAAHSSQPATDVIGLFPEPQPRH